MKISFTIEICAGHYDTPKQIKAISKRLHHLETALKKVDPVKQVGKTLEKSFAKMEAGF